MGAVLCSHYYSILITLHRNFLPITPNYTQGPPALPQKAINSARSYISLAPSVKNVVPPSHHLAFFIQGLFTAAVIEMCWRCMYLGRTRKEPCSLPRIVIEFVASWGRGLARRAQMQRVALRLGFNGKGGDEQCTQMTILDARRGRPSANSPPAVSSSSAPVTHSSRAESRSNRGKSSRAKSRESRASLISARPVLVCIVDLDSWTHRLLTVIAVQIDAGMHRRRGRALEDFDRKDSGSGSPTSPTFHSAFPTSYQKHD